MPRWPTFPISALNTLKNRWQQPINTLRRISDFEKCSSNRSNPTSADGEADFSSNERGLRSVAEARWCFAEPKFSLVELDLGGQTLSADSGRILPNEVSWGCCEELSEFPDDDFLSRVSSTSRWSELDDLPEEDEILLTLRWKRGDTVLKSTMSKIESRFGFFKMNVLFRGLSKRN